MHFQARIQDWPDAVRALPPNGNSLVKAVSDPGLLHEAVQLWAAAGRPRAGLTTVYRHYDLAMPPRGWDWEKTKLWWRLMFYRFVDRTYLEQYAGSIDLMQGTNETTSNSTWADPADKAYHLQSEQAAAEVWNHEFRGRVVRSLDRGEGFIPAHCKLTLLSGPVGNDIPREIFELSLAEDCPIDYHAYTRYRQGVRYERDWAEDSGRWAVLEEQAGLKPQWVFGECGPYAGVNEGWRHQDVLGGDLAGLQAAMRAWYADVVATPAFREGRVLGQGAWFTSGNDPTWQHYQLFTSDLIALCNAIREIWARKEKAYMPTFTANTEEELGQAITVWEKAGFRLTGKRIVHVAEMEMPPAPQPLFRVRITVGSLNVRQGPAVTFQDIGDVLAGQSFEVWEVAASGWYRISPTEQKWISGSSIYSERLP